MKRGDIIILAPPSPFNKPRPGLIIQAEVFAEKETVTVALISSDPAYTNGFRVPIQPSVRNGLRKPSEIMIDNLQTIRLDRIGGFAGEAEPEVMRQVDIALRLFLSLP
jgi:mRNA interferase MazF